MLGGHFGNLWRWYLLPEDVPLQYTPMVVIACISEDTIIRIGKGKYSAYNVELIPGWMHAFPPHR